MNIMRLVAEAHRLYPELRMAQLICCAAAKAVWQNDDVFYLPDDRLAHGLQSMIDERRKS